MAKEFAFVEKYRPKTVQEVILPLEMKKQFQSYVDNEFIPTILLSGNPGMGKTSIALALLEEIKAEYIIINGSLEGRTIDVLREYIQDFAGSSSLFGKRKYVLMDEFDMAGHHVMKALRGVIERYSSNCGFIFTCNYPEDIIVPIDSRMAMIDFKIEKKDKSLIANAYLMRLKEILELEGITYDIKVLVRVIIKYFPDFRKTLNEVQAYASKNKNVDNGILSITRDEDLKNLINFLKDRDFKSMRKWVAECDLNMKLLCRAIFENIYSLIKTDSIPQAILTLAEYQYRSVNGADRELNMTAMLTVLMSETNFL